ncbi:LysR family transcriptional regulator [Methylocaldum sp. BRCS4]|uniref:LysR family transcriptional regulator n=1 Tax=Methylocaldum sp. 14B TaxID=1912213 RepID=UPI00098A9589|nr:LysR family transcriptional regulator [Methylocaldum sp. 14B]MVF22126.1 LysR family transcriptional regulator [Methylocaldum sp. BRCS4]
MLNLRHLDFTMLLAFDLLMQELNVSRAAEKMFITQPAMSQILQRLRQQFDDPLLVRTPTGMKPTERASALLEPVRSVLRNAEHILKSPAQFDPATSHERFILAGSDYFEFLVLPRLIERVCNLAPRIEIHVQRPDTGSLEARLQNQEIDLILGFQAMLKLPAHLNWVRLFDDTIVCIARRDYAGVEDEITLEEYLQRNQLLISSCDLNAQIVERWLMKQGLERRVAVVVPNFLSAPFTVATTDLLLSLPRRIAEACIKSSPLKLVQVPFGLPAYDFVVAWHPLRDKDPAHQWLREQILEVSREIDLCPLDQWD